MDKKDFRPIRNLFSFSRKELSGFYALSFIIILFISLPFLSEFLLAGDQVGKQESDQLDSLVSLMESENQRTFFRFDPNTISIDSLKLLGVSEEIASVWLNYVASGGRFSKPSDIKKIYGFDSLLAGSLLPYVVIPGSKKERKEETEVHNYEKYDRPKGSTEKSNFEKKDINAAASQDLIQVFGIGEVLSSRIIKYRNLLGGFVTMNQLHEVYGLDSLVVSELRERYYVEKSFSPKKININTAEYKTVLRHPYLSKELTDKLFEVRNQKDYVFTERNFRQLVDNDSVCFIVLPYIEF